MAAFVAISRGAHDAQIFTSDAAKLGHELSRDVSRIPAIQQAQMTKTIEHGSDQVNEIGQGFGMGL
jgi:hypothetical protein